VLGQYHDDQYVAWSHLLVLGKFIECVYTLPMMGHKSLVSCPAILFYPQYQ
jgi:hypothetical protein